MFVNAKGKQMKKIVFAIATVVMCATLQAATVNWGETSSTSGTTSGDLVLYVIALDESWMASNIGSLSQAEINSWTVGNSHGVVMFSTAMNGTGYASGLGGTLNGVEPSANAKVYMLAFDQNTVSGSANYGASATIHTVAAGDVTLHNYDLTGFSGFNVATPFPVPEPASMALFGLGAGVIALRRRFKKKA